MLTLSAFAALALNGCLQTQMTQPVPPAKSIYEFTMKDINGKDVPLKKFKGNVLVVVNTASRCGLTPQYEKLQALYEKYKDKGLIVLGFPANNFGGQEPGSNEEIKTFCSTNYKVSFPMFSKISVKGNDIAPLYAWLIGSSGTKADIEWNFAKFIVGKDGKVVARLSSREAPDSTETIKQIEAAMKS